MISDIVLLRELPKVIKESIEAYIGCLSGAMMKDDYLQKIEDADFRDIKVVDETNFPVDFMADDPTEVMKKHLKDQLIPPDHINTSLSAGVSEVIEIMMAKRKEDRYSNMEELLVDLEALQEGRPPLRAHQRFDLAELEKLEEGEVLEPEEEERAYKDEAVARYQAAVLVLSVVAAIAILIIVFLVLRGAR